MGNLKNDLEKKIMGLAAQDVDIIFVTEPYIIERLSKMKLKNVSKQIQLVLVKDLSDLRALSVVAMRELGWVPKKELDDERRNKGKAASETDRPDQPQGGLAGPEENDVAIPVGADQGCGQADHLPGSDDCQRGPAGTEQGV